MGVLIGESYFDNNKKSSPTALVMPLGSLASSEIENDIHPDSVFLERIPQINNNLCYGIPNQIQAISKLRIIKPKNRFNDTYILSDGQLDLIDKKIYDMLFGQSKVIHEVALAYREAAAGKT